VMGFREQNFLSNAQLYMSGFSGKLTFSLQGIDNDFYCAMDPRDSMPAASAAKIYILGALFSCAEMGQIRLDESFILQWNDLEEGSGILGNMMPGMKLSIRDAAELMIIVSDNTATNILLDRIGGPETVNAHLAAAGLASSRINRRLSEDPEIMAQCHFADTTAADLAGYLAAVRTGRILSPEYAGIFMDILTAQHDKGMFPRDMNLRDFYDDPACGNGTVANKTGTMEGIRTDAGILTLDSGKQFSYAVMTDGCRDRRYSESNEAVLLMAALGKCFYNAVL
jgi:beta-lactamase class A